jgi:hypothetical protein
MAESTLGFANHCCGASDFAESLPRFSLQFVPTVAPWGKLWSMQALSYLLDLMADGTEWQYLPTVPMCHGTTGKQSSHLLCRARAVRISLHLSQAVCMQLRKQWCWG